MFTRHADQPGVVGAIGRILGNADINITNMQVGVANGTNSAIAVIGISELLNDKSMAAIKGIPAISRVMQVAM